VRARSWSVIFAWSLACGGSGDASPSDATSTSDGGSTSSTGSTTGADSDPTGSSSTADPDSSTGAPAEPLRFDHVQALGTHNSYHVAPAVPIVPWAYTHRPLDEQLGIGVRQFELDVVLTEEGDEFAVFHVDQLDEETTCPTLTECISTMSAWSEAHPHHHPILVLVEPKDAVPAEEAEAWIATLEAVVEAAWPRERLVIPDLVARDHGSLRAGLEAEGWPTIDELRGRALFVLHEGGALRSAYTAGSLADRVLFPDAMGDLSPDWAAVHTMNDPIADGDAIAEVVAAGHLVRTRADADNVEPSANDTTRRDAALASGAHFVSTDFPEPTDSGYVVAIPDGTPSRCNPMRTAVGCTSEAIEDPTLLQ
jgi:hypothetical protein